MLEINLGDDYNPLTWHWRIMHPDGHVSASTIYDTANWDDAEAQTRFDLVRRTTDWYDDESVHRAAAYLSKRGTARGDSQYGPDELYRYAAWQRAARAANGGRTRRLSRVGLRARERIRDSPTRRNRYRPGVIMPIYNVLTPVVALITADSPAEAMADHAQALSRSGHEVYPEGADAFESEPAPPEAL